jgi:hypothetical protein
LKDLREIERKKKKNRKGGEGQMEIKGHTRIVKRSEKIVRRKGEETQKCKSRDIRK